MHFATSDRMARLSGKPLGGWTILYYRVAIAILIVYATSLWLMPETAYAQDDVEMWGIPAETLPLETNSVEMNPAEGISSSIIHVIEAGDNLTNVARRYGVEAADLAAYNQILDFNHVVIGQKLRIPPVGVTITQPAAEILNATPGADGYHVVRIGESLSAIARQYNLTLDELMELNEIEDANNIAMGKMLRLRENIEPPSNVTQPELEVVHYKVKRGDTLSEIAEAYYTTIEQLLEDNELTSEEVKVGQELRILPPTDAADAFGVDAPPDGERLILIDLSEQTLTAYQGNVRVLYSIVSTGKAATPTRTGEFAIYHKYKSQHMSGEDYDLPGVPWVMYYDDEMAIHGAYWHANFGIPTSHGCTNMTIPDAKALYSWAPEGTRVIVQE